MMNLKSRDLPRPSRPWFYQQVFFPLISVLKERGILGLNKKNLLSGFMLAEIMIALAIISLITTPIFFIIRRSLFASARNRDEQNELLVMENFMTECTYEAKTGKSQTATKTKPVEEPAGTLKYTRELQRKRGTFKNFPEEQIKNLCVQKVEGAFGNRKEELVSFLYKPVEKSS